MKVGLGDDHEGITILDITSPQNARYCSLIGTTNTRERKVMTTKLRAKKIPEAPDRFWSW